MRNHFKIKYFLSFIITLFAVITVSQAAQAQTPYEPVPYEEIGPILEQHDKESDRVSLEVIGQSALGHDLYEVVISEPEDDLDQIKSIREEMIQNPGDA